MYVSCPIYISKPHVPLAQSLEVLLVAPVAVIITVTTFDNAISYSRELEL